jgi:hypothetical protein
MAYSHKVNLKTSLKSWSLKTSNHGLPKISSSTHTIFAILWSIVFSLFSLYCISYIIYDLRLYAKFNTNTNVNITNVISAEIPTLSVCLDPIFGNNINFNMVMLDCEIKRSKYLEIEKCGNESFTKVPNGCYMFNTSHFKNEIITFTDESRDVGLKLTFKSNNENTTGIFVIVHDLNKIPQKPNNNRYYKNLFQCAKIKANTHISYALTERRRINKQPYPFSNCITSWSSVRKDIVDIVPSYLNKDYDQEVCFLACVEVLLKQSDACRKSFCPVKCTADSYIITQTTNCDDKRDIYDLATVNVYFKETRYTNIQEEPAMELGQLMGSIGYGTSNFVYLSA